MAKEKTIAAKAKVVEELSARLKDAPSTVIVNYTGITVEDDTKMRKALREAKVDYSVIKNRITLRALEALGYKEFGAPLCGSAAAYPAVPERSVRDEIYYRTCQFAKRQDTWFRHQSTPIYVQCGETAGETASAVREAWNAHGPWTMAFEA